MKAHFVEFLSPGTFVHEVTTKAIDAWDVERAKLMAIDIVERYGARPYGFRFITRSRSDDELDSKVTAQSGVYYLGGTIRTIEQVEADADPAETILLSNMRSNGWPRIVTNTNSWKWTAPLADGDEVLDFTMPADARAGHDKHAAMLAERAKP